MVTDFDVLIAGTEPITDKVMSRASRLKLISRVGIGLDGVDLLSAEKRGIKVSYTPDAPAPAVAEVWDDVSGWCNQPDTQEARRNLSMTLRHLVSEFSVAPPHSWTPA